MKNLLVFLFVVHGLVAVCSAQRAPSVNALLDPKSPAVNQTAPETYRVLFSTTKGDFTVQVTRAWAPKGADRFYNLVKNGFYNDVRFFRVIPDFMVQFGINGDPAIQKNWANANIPDDPKKESNKKAYVTFATRGANTRTTQVFINLKDN